MIHAATHRDGGAVSLSLTKGAIKFSDRISRAAALALAKLLEGAARDTDETDAFEAHFESRDE